MTRLEDRDLLQGAGTFVDDLRLDGMLHAAVLRSPVAHGRIVRIDPAPALRRRGVVAALTFRDLAQPVPALPNLRPHPALRAATPYPLAPDRVRYVGEPVAIVVAASRYLAEDALDAIKADYEPLPVVGDLLEAAQGRPALVHEDLGSNIAARLKQEVGDAAEALRSSECVLRRTLRISRSTGQPIETRGVVATLDQETGCLTVWASCQRPHQNRTHIAAMLGLPEDRVRVIAPNVGGGFGPKGRFYPEDFLIPYLARTLGSPVKWIEDRREHLLTTTQERQQIHDVTVAFRRDGTVTALVDRFVHDMGAYVSAGLVVPFNTLCLLPGPYRIRHLSIEAECVYTTRVATSPVRGAGQPEATFVIEHVMDAVADALQMDPADVRRRNLIPHDAFPYDVGLKYLDDQPIVYDSGNVPLCLEKALEAISYASFRAEQRALSARGIYRGAGVACYVEMTGVGPQEEARVRVDENGRVTVVVGCGSQGQGHRTVLAQLCARELGLRPDDVTVIEGDTGQAARSMGTYGSRTAVVAGNAVLLAARNLKKVLCAAAAPALGVPVDQVELASWRAHASGAPEHGIGLVELVRTLKGTKGPAGTPEQDAHVVAETSGTFSPGRATTSSGVHAAIVEVERESGDVRIVRYVIVHDCGRAINPQLVEGQILGGFAHGLGETFYERVVHDEDGQPLTTTFRDYLLPVVATVPEIFIEHVETVSPLNDLGAKGAGEGGVIPVSAALSLAVQDALTPMGAIVDEVPLTPEIIWRAVRSDGDALVSAGAHTQGDGAR